MLTVDYMSIKGVSCNDKSTENDQLLKFFSIFQRIDLVLRPAPILFWFIVMSL